MDRFDCEKAKKIIEMSGLKVKKIAEKLEIDNSTMSRYLNGKNQPPRTFILAFAVTMNVDPQILLKKEAA